MQPVIELENLSVRLGRRTILKNLTASLGGRCIGLLGPNGSGKTTLIRTLLGFHPPSSGSGRVLGHDIRTHARLIRTWVGFMPENDSYIPRMSGIRFVRMMGEISGLPAGVAMERAHEAMFYVGLGEARYRKLGTYSTGMKQLVKLAQALVHGPRILVLDEPTNGLDPPARQRMLRLVNEIRAAADVHILLSSHLLKDVEDCADEVIILKDGEIAVYCNLEEERRANRKFIEMETVGDHNGFADSIRKLGCECVFYRGRLKTVLPEAVEVRDLYRIAAAQDIQIRRLDYKRDSLQDIFLKAMEGQPSGSL